MYSLFLRLDSNNGQVALFNEGVLEAQCFSDNYYEMGANKFLSLSAVDHCLEISQVDEGSIDEVVLVNKPFQNFDNVLLRSLNLWPRGVKGYIDGLVDIWKTFDAIRVLKKRFQSAHFYYCQPEDALINSLSDIKDGDIAFLESDFTDTVYQARIYKKEKTNFSVLATVKKNFGRSSTDQNSLRYFLESAEKNFKEVKIKKWTHKKESINTTNDSPKILDESLLLVGAKKCIDCMKGREKKILFSERKISVDHLKKSLDKINIKYETVSETNGGQKKIPLKNMGYWSFASIELTGLIEKHYILTNENGHFQRKGFKDENGKALRNHQDAYRAFMKSNLQGLVLCDEILIKKKNMVSQDV